MTPMVEKVQMTNKTTRNALIVKPLVERNFISRMAFVLFNMFMNSSGKYFWKRKGGNLQAKFK
jgi:hypothetical protein